MRRMTTGCVGVLTIVCGLCVAQSAAAEKDSVVCRFTAAGELDTGFAGTGCLTVQSGGGGWGIDDEFLDVAVDARRRVVTCGYYTWYDGSKQFLVYRLTEAGDFDWTFGGGGWGGVTLNQPAAEACALDSAGRLVTVSAFSRRPGPV